jgi:hypothetical protein
VRLRQALAKLQRDLEANSGVTFELDFNRSHAIVRTHPALSEAELERFKAVFAAFRQKVAAPPRGLTEAEARARLVPFIVRFACIPMVELETWPIEKLGAAADAIETSRGLGARMPLSAEQLGPEFDRLAGILGDDLFRVWKEPKPVPTPALAEDDARELAWFRDLHSRAHLKPALLSNTTGTRWAIVPVERVEGTEEYMDRKAAAEMREARARGLFAEPSSGPGDTHSPQPARDVVTLIDYGGGHVEAAQVGVDMSAGTDTSVVQRIAVVDGRAEVVGEGVVVERPQVAMDGAAVAEAHARASRKSKRERSS